MLLMAVLLPFILTFFGILFMILVAGISFFIHRYYLKKDFQKYSSAKYLLVFALIDYGMMITLYILVSLFSGDILSMLVFGMVLSFIALPICGSIFFGMHKLMVEKYDSSMPEMMTLEKTQKNLNVAENPEFLLKKTN